MVPHQPVISCESGGKASVNNNNKLLDDNWQQMKQVTYLT